MVFCRDPPARARRGRFWACSALRKPHQSCKVLCCMDFENNLEENMVFCRDPPARARRGRFWACSASCCTPRPATPPCPAGRHSRAVSRVFPGMHRFIKTRDASRQNISSRDMEGSPNTMYWIQNLCDRSRNSSRLQAGRAASCRHKTRLVMQLARPLAAQLALLCGPPERQVIELQSLGSTIQGFRDSMHMCRTEEWRSLCDGSQQGAQNARAKPFLCFHRGQTGFSP